MPNPQRMEILKKLPPLEAVQAWLNGDFGMNEESALCTAIRKDPQITLSDDAIAEVIVNAMDDELTAAACLERLAASVGA